MSDHLWAYWFGAAISSTISFLNPLNTVWQLVGSLVFLWGLLFLVDRWERRKA